MNLLSPDSRKVDHRQRLADAIEHLDHVLPGQAPILNFVHHNTLHGYQHLPFVEALETSERLTGIYGYWPDEHFRTLYAGGRITDADVGAAFAQQAESLNDTGLIHCGERTIGAREVWRIALIQGIDAIAPSELNWRIEEQRVLERFQESVGESTRLRARESARAETEAEAVHDLWNACLDLLGLERFHHRPDELLYFDMELAKNTLAEFHAGSADDGHSDPVSHERMLIEARQQLSRLFEDVGAGLSLRSLLLALTGHDLLDEVRPALIRFCASHLDEGLAAWSAPNREQGLYTAWRHCAAHDLAQSLNELPNGRQAWAELPEDALDAIIFGLQRLGIPERRWTGYLQRLALEIPGWSGIINWRQHRPGYPANQHAPSALTDYLAIRLFLDALWVEHLCRLHWCIPGRLDTLQAYFARNLSEFSARFALFADNLPEYLAASAHKLIDQGWSEPYHRENWRGLADMIWRWKHSPIADHADRHTVYRSVWRLFLLAQHLGLSGPDLASLTTQDAERLLQTLDELSPSQRGYLWLLAYEHHYREDLFTALRQNHGRGRWARRQTRPEAQVIFCMDDREESLRRHLEELNPAIETLGAAGFFGVAMYWRGLDDTESTPLCPVVVTPAHEIREESRPEQPARHERHDRRRRAQGVLGRVLNQEIRRNLLTSSLLIGTLAPGVLGVLAGKVFFPRLQAAISRALSWLWIPKVATRLHLTAPAESPPASPDSPRLGFTDTEQADRVTGFLRVIGLTDGFAPLVVVAGHGSISQNNPHLAAYDCGACSGRHGGPNARAFAAMANRPEVRRLVRERGIVIPEDTWFLGSEHNTADEAFLWFDLEDLPARYRAPLEKLRGDLDQALQWSAHERCRRLASAPRNPARPQALRHVIGRTVDFSQARPELGHATNAAALIGRRSVTRGAFLDRRVFLISYDPTQDPDGKILENILLAAGPVGAGINLEYYFSTVNNERYGCGSKVPHNVTGLFAVMEGASSDLRTGLPRQMVEIHEAMRLQVVVEATEEVLTAIYQRQPPLRELIGNEWICLSAIHPHTGAISTFHPSRGFIPWHDRHGPLPRVRRSADWYAGHSDARPTALIETESDGPHATPPPVTAQTTRTEPVGAEEVLHVG